MKKEEYRFVNDRFGKIQISIKPDPSTAKEEGSKTLHVVKKKLPFTKQDIKR